MLRRAVPRAIADCTPQHCEAFMFDHNRKEMLPEF